MAARLRVKLIYSPLIRPRSEPRPPSPSRGKALPKRLLPSGEAAARRRLMRGGVVSIVHLGSCCGNIGPHPASVGASATFPLAGEGSPQKASPFGRSCRPQAADEGRRYLYCPFTELLREHCPSSGLRPPFPRGGRLIYYPSKSQYSAAPSHSAIRPGCARPGPACAGVSSPAFRGIPASSSRSAHSRNPPG